jgi:hypothetical protein
MDSRRISLTDELYWMLMELAAEQKMRYDDLLEKWIRDAYSRRGKKQGAPGAKRTRSNY